MNNPIEILEKYIKVIKLEVGDLEKDIARVSNIKLEAENKIQNKKDELKELERALKILREN